MNFHDERAAQLEQLARAARQCGVDPLFDRVDDMAPARSIVWLVLTWVAISFALALILTACGGGIDTPEELAGPPAPRPCPISMQCQSDPTPG